MRLAQLILFSLLTLASAFSAIADAEEGGDNEQQRTEQKREQLRQRIARLQDSIRKTRQEKDALSAELADSAREIGAIIAQLNKLQKKQQTLQQKLTGLKHRQSDLQTHLETSRHKLAQLLRSAYMTGREERLKLFLNQQDPAALSRLLAYHDYISRARTRQLQALSQDLESLRSLSRQIGKEQSRLDRLRQQQQTRKEQLEEHQKQRKGLLKQVDARLQQQGDKLARWQEDERRLAGLLKELQNTLHSLELPEQKGFRESKGQLGWPVRGRLRKTFGAQKIGNLRWDGVIIGAKEGAEVRTIHAGRVAWADWLRGYGLLIIVEHGDGFMSLYGNNQSLFKETGDWVETGEIIAQAGTGEGHARTGVYFGIRYQGKALNPVRWCKKRRRR